MARIANMDGDPHELGGDCCDGWGGINRTCRKCGGVLHLQAIYGGILEMCERCDADEFRERGPQYGMGMNVTDGVKL